MCPRVAVSIAHRGKDFDFSVAAEFTQRLAPIVMKEGLPRGVLLNVNIPQPWTGKVQFTRQSSKITRNLLQPRHRSSRSAILLAARTEIHRADGAGHRSRRVRDGAISITPLMLDHTHTASLNHLSHWAKTLEESFRR